MADTAVYDWLMDNACVPIRYRTARELLHDLKTAKHLQRELLDIQPVRLCLRNLKPETPPQHSWIEHGSFDFCLENALLKALQLGLHGSLPQIMDAVGYYLAGMRQAAALSQKRRNFTAILTANLLELAGIEDESTRRFMLGSLDELYRFALQGRHDFYLNVQEQKRLTDVPQCWKTGRPFLKPEILLEYGFAYPLLYDVVGLHALYRLNDPGINEKIDTVTGYISTDAFHRAVADGYGILPEGKGVYHAMGWDPKYPGWFGAAAYLEHDGAPRLLFYALHASRYPAVRKTKWFTDLLHCLDGYRTDDGRYAFPAAWLPEKQGYAVLGSHLSFGENRRRKIWREIESTFYMQLLKRG